MSKFNEVKESLRPVSRYVRELGRRLRQKSGYSGVIIVTALVTGYSINDPVVAAATNVVAILVGAYEALRDEESK